MKKKLAIFLAAVLLYSASPAMAAGENVKQEGKRDLKVDNAQQQSQEQNAAVKPENGNQAQAAAGLSIDLQTEKGVDESYAPGDELKIKFSVSDDAYVTLIDLGTSGKSSVIFPNSHASNNYIKKGEIYSIPENNSYKITVQPPVGDQYILAIASKQKIDVKPENLSDLTAPDMQYVVAGKQVSKKDLKVDENLGNATPVDSPMDANNFQGFYNSVAQETKVEPGKEFATATCRIKIRKSEKMLKITSNPSGAKVLVDGSIVGQTPCNVSGASYPGIHEVTVIMAGYETKVQKILFPAAFDKALNVELKPLGGE